MNQATLNRSRNDKFIMVLDLPKAMKNSFDPVLGSTYKIDPIQFSIYGSPVPLISVPEKDIPFGGQVLRTSSFSRPAYNPLSIKFLVDNNYKNYWTLWKWINLYNDSIKSTSNMHDAVNLPITKNHTPHLSNPLDEYSSTFARTGLNA